MLKFHKREPSMMPELHSRDRLYCLPRSYVHVPAAAIKSIQDLIMDDRDYDLVIESIFEKFGICLESGVLIEIFEIFIDDAAAPGLEKGESESSDDF